MEKNLKINNISKVMLDKEYFKKQYPIVLVGPFAKTNDLFNDSHLHLGVTKKK